jgi:cell wall-associated NlpC family hydrolase
MDQDARLAYLARLLWGSRYGWGNELIGGTDCSGSVCWALWLMGFKIRVAADYMEDKLTMPCIGLPKPGFLAFWWTSDGDRVSHVAIFSDTMMIMNAQNKFCDMPVGTQIQQFAGRAYQFKRLSWATLKYIDERGGLAYGVDKGLKPLLGLFNVDSPPMQSIEPVCKELKRKDILP